MIRYSKAKYSTRVNKAPTKQIFVIPAMPKTCWSLSDRVIVKHCWNSKYYATCKTDAHTTSLQMLHKPLEYAFDDHLLSLCTRRCLVTSFQSPSNKVASSSVLRLALYCPWVLYYQFLAFQRTHSNMNPRRIYIRTVVQHDAYTSYTVTVTNTLREGNTERINIRENT